MTLGNRSTAVMQRRKPAPKALDHFPTPPFATRALCEVLAAELGPLDALSAWDPCCAEGHMVKPLLEAFGAVRASDVHQYRPFLAGGDHELVDFALAGWNEPIVDVLVMNPPFRLAYEFIQTALKRARRAVAVLVRSAFTEGEDRYRRLWTKLPPTIELQFAERVVMLEGRLVRRGSIDPFTGKKATSATAYCWLVWIVGDDRETRKRWIAPSMQRLERPGDYPDHAAELADAPLLEMVA